MREIKFRAWSNMFNENKIFYDVELHLKDDGYWWLFNNKTRIFQSGDRFSIMQYTGLKDKNGKEIYEGDIVRYDAVLYQQVGRVEYCEGAYELIHDDGSFLCHLWSDIEERFEVIGNIYDKPRTSSSGNEKEEAMSTVNNGFWDLPAEERAARMENECERNEVDNFFDLSPEERGRAYYKNEEE